MKHAFPYLGAEGKEQRAKSRSQKSEVRGRGERKGEITITLKENSYDSTLSAPRSPLLILTASDNGIGFPESTDLTDTRTLGLQLVNALVEQLNGKIDI